MERFNIYVSGSAPALWPTDTFFAMLWTDDELGQCVPKLYPYSGKWGEILSTQLLDSNYSPMPRRLDMVWLSIVERKFYSIEADLPWQEMEQLWKQPTDDDKPLFTHIVVGMAPYGQAAVWFRGYRKAVLVSWLRGTEIDVPMEQFMSLRPDVTLDENCDFYINNDARVKENLLTNGLPDVNLFDGLMAQYCYRVVPLFEVWDDSKEQWHRYQPDDTNIPVLDYVEMSCTDGTMDKLHDDFLTRHHQRGCPEQINLVWHTGKSEWLMYVWLDSRVVAPLLKRFYGAHRDAHVDLLVHCDPLKRHYELALFRYGMQAPQLLPNSSYQMIVFKSMFENYISDNYDQPSGAWVW